MQLGSKVLVLTHKDCGIKDCPELIPDDIIEAKIASITQVANYNKMMDKGGWDAFPGKEKEFKNWWQDQLDTKHYPEVAKAAPKKTFDEMKGILMGFLNNIVE